MLVANYFGGSVAVLPILPDGRLGDATDVKQDDGEDRPHQGDECSAGQLRLQRARPDPRAHDRGRSLRALRAPRRSGAGSDLRLEVRRAEGRADAERAARGVAAAGRRAAAFRLPSERPLALLHPGGGLDHRPLRLRRHRGTADRRGRRSPPCRPGSPAATSAPRSWSRPTAGSSTPATGCTTASGSSPSARTATLTYVGEEWTRGNYPRSFGFDPTGRFLYSCNQRADNVAVFRVDRKTGRPRLHRPLHRRRQPLDHRLSRSGDDALSGPPGRFDLLARGKSRPYREGGGGRDGSGTGLSRNRRLRRGAPSFPMEMLLTSAWHRKSPPTSSTFRTAPRPTWRPETLTTADLGFEVLREGLLLLRDASPRRGPRRAGDGTEGCGGGPVAGRPSGSG